MLAFAKGKYRVRQAETPADLRLALLLRSKAFHPNANLTDGDDSDRFDPVCRHVLIEDQDTGRLVCCYRMMHLPNGADIEQSYSAQFYDLSALKSHPAPMLEIGRFCVDPEVSDPDVLRLAWGVLANFVDELGVEMLFGCSSFDGLDAAPYRNVFSQLRDCYLAPKRWSPGIKATNVVRFAEDLSGISEAEGERNQMPPLLKTYLLMGGWVSDHAVIDPHMNTLHVFTGVETKAIPESRKRLLRAVTAGAA